MLFVEKKFTHFSFEGKKEMMFFFLLVPSEDVDSKTRLCALD
jgi:hypothetical protein